ncbi:hypothetical protein BU25DRAFT_484090 [Macroventuria anomochaeta]|uniref:Uncharacterized protein n=1 Tax=Macroventuria anomochaeta TaxID=301207 RepID=A0ACB6RIZ0_9PLEO|nr:uncharacterized protein BU25DRAFT_484090 [Macroventuria anomochaeta]KAF2621068.1 hypothetical protein BU25DRAFT_484090 [Macroventuria anomochaeta]
MWWLSLMWLHHATRSSRTTGRTLRMRLSMTYERRFVYLRLAAANVVTNMVLGAMGYGANGCSPRAVAREMKDALEREEFAGWFGTIILAVYAAGPLGKYTFDYFYRGDSMVSSEPRGIRVHAC